jgi:hypothetical protein
LPYHQGAHQQPPSHCIAHEPTLPAQYVHRTASGEESTPPATEHRRHACVLVALWLQPESHKKGATPVKVVHMTDAQQTPAATQSSSQTSKRSTAHRRTRYPAPVPPSLGKHSCITVGKLVAAIRCMASTASKLASHAHKHRAVIQAWQAMAAAGSLQKPRKLKHPQAPSHAMWVAPARVQAREPLAVWNNQLQKSCTAAMHSRVSTKADQHKSLTGHRA